LPSLAPKWKTNEEACRSRYLPVPSAAMQKKQLSKKLIIDN